MEIVAIPGSFCPSCQKDGGLFHMGEGWLVDLKEFYDCQNCLRIMTVQEYNELITNYKTTLNYLKQK